MDTKKYSRKNIEEIINLVSQTLAPQPKRRETYSFPEYLYDNTALADELLKGFAKAPARDIRFMIDILQERELLYKVSMKPLAESIRIYFKRDAGSDTFYESIRKTVYAPMKHKFQYQLVEGKINLILKDLK